jgi:hypothetical protein
MGGGAGCQGNSHVIKEMQIPDPSLPSLERGGAGG